jgi:hypothetical protein
MSARTRRSQGEISPAAGRLATCGRAAQPPSPPALSRRCDRRSRYRQSPVTVH